MEEQVYKARKGKFLLVTRVYTGKPMKTHFDTNEAAHAAATAFWTSEEREMASSAFVYNDQGRKTPPPSYVDAKRPPLDEAMRLEEEGTFEEVSKALARRGYFTPPPRPWGLGRIDRGHGHGEWAVLDRFGGVVAAPLTKEAAEFIIAACNAFTGPT